MSTAAGRWVLDASVGNGAGVAGGAPRSADADAAFEWSVVVAASTPVARIDLDRLEAVARRCAPRAVMDDLDINFIDRCSMISDVDGGVAGMRWASLGRFGVASSAVLGRDGSVATFSGADTPFDMAAAVLHIGGTIAWAHAVQSECGSLDQDATIAVVLRRFPSSRPSSTSRADERSRSQDVARASARFGVAAVPEDWRELTQALCWQLLSALGVENDNFFFLEQVTSQIARLRRGRHGLFERGPSTTRSVAILFVHGIGSQAKGETLTEWGAAIQQWISRRSRVLSWSSRVAPLAVVPERPGDMPIVKFTVESESANVEVMMAEAHWASAFVSPSYGQLAKWAALAGPEEADALLADHRFAPGRTVESIANPLIAWLHVFESIRRALLGLGVLILGAVAFPMLMVLPFLRGVPRLSAMATFGVSTLTTVLGDCYALIQNELSFGAMRGVVHSAIERLAQESDHVVIVAHSQGAAVVDAVLRERRYPKVRTLVSLGSGTARLARQRERQARGYTISDLISIYGSRALFLASAFMLPLGYMQHAMAAVSFELYAQSTRRLLRVAPGVESLNGVAWLDLFTGHDPVPTAFDPPSGCWRFKIANDDSPLSDHTSYFRNRDVAVASVVTMIALHPDMTPIRRLAIPALDLYRANAARVSRVRLASFVRGFFSLATVALWAFPVVDTIYGAMGASIANLAARFYASEWLSGDLISHALAVLAGIASTRFLASALLSLWHREDTRRLMRHCAPRGYSFGAGYSILAAVPLLVCSVPFGLAQHTVEWWWTPFLTACCCALIHWTALWQERIQQALPRQMRAPKAWRDFDVFGPWRGGSGGI